MFERLINKLETRGSLDKINTEEWIEISALEASMENNQNNNNNNNKLVSLYPPLFVIKDFLDKLSKTPNAKDFLQSNLPSLLRISNFCKQHYQFFKKNNYQHLDFNLDQWLRFITHFEKNNRKNLTAPYFFEQIALILKIDYNQVIMMSTQRNLKRTTYKSASLKNGARMRMKRRLIHNVEGCNEFICVENYKERQVLAKLAKTGVTIVDKLCPASPEQGFNTVFQTPDGGKVRPVFTHNGLTLFKPITPIKDKPKPVNPSSLGKTAKRLEFEQARPLKYVATLPPIETQYGTKRRRSGASIMGRSAASVFIDHGIDTPKEQTYKIHWSHLIAKVLADDTDINLQNEIGEQPLINLVPATGSSNLNVWLAVESFIIEVLSEKKTDKIIMEVTPHYEPGISIPKLITYDLHWDEEIEGEKVSKHEQFHCDPLSQHRINKKMQDSISTLREDTISKEKLSKANISVKNLANQFFSTDELMDIADMSFEYMDEFDFMEQELDEIPNMTVVPLPEEQDIFSTSLNVY